MTVQTFLVTGKRVISKIILILLVLFPFTSNAQAFWWSSVNTSGGGGGVVYRRVVLDIGGNGTTGGGVKTPNNSAGATGQDGSGKWWNNILGIGSPKTLGNFALVDTAGNVVTGFGIYVSTKVGTLSATDSSLNSAVNATAPVGDYPTTAVQDGMYLSPSITVSWTIQLPPGLKCSVSFFGVRAQTGPRITQLKKSTDGAYTLEWNVCAPSGSGGNTDYNQRATISNLVNGDVLNTVVKAGSSFGGISVIDVVIQNQ